MSGPQYPQPPQNPQGGYPPQPQGGWPQQQAPFPQAGGPGYPPRQPYPQPVPANKGMPIWGWLLIGFAAFCLLGIVAVGGAMWYFSKKIESAAKNPVAAAVRLAAIANPDVEVLDVNETTGKVTVRDKKTGKTVVIDADNVARTGKIEIQTEEGKAVIGGGSDVKAPAWLMLPSSIKTQGGISGESGTGVAGSIVFTSTDSVETLKNHFETRLKESGFEVQSSSTSTVDNKQSAHMQFRHEERKRGVTLMIAQSDEGTGGTITYTEGEN